MVAHAFCEALAWDAPLEPEKVQVARLARLGGWVTAGSATGDATATAARAASARVWDKGCIFGLIMNKYDGVGSTESLKKLVLLPSAAKTPSEPFV